MNMLDGPVTVRRFVTLDSWRGICALMVAAGHLNTVGNISNFWPIAQCTRFVDFFFVLSGFVIAHAYGAELRGSASAMWPFFIRRFGRLFPLHIAVLLGFIGFELAVLLAGLVGIDPGRAAFSDKNTLSSLPANIALIQSWNILDGTTWNVPAWSISAEIVAYALFALLCVVGGRFATLLMVCSGILGLLVVAWFAPENMSSTFDFGVPRGIYGFAAGVAVQALWLHLQHMRLPAATLVEAGTLALMLATLLAIRGELSPLIVPVFGAVVLVFAFEQGGISKLLSGLAWRWLGDRSYSIYMVHFLLVLVVLSVALVATRLGVPMFGRVDGVASLVGPAWAMDLVLILYLGIVILVSAGTFHWIENPGRRYFNRLARPRVRQLGPVAF